MKAKMKPMRASLFRAAVLVVVLAVALYGCTTGGSTSSSTPTASSTTSSTGGVPDLAQEEARCAAALPNEPWYRTLDPGFNFGSERTSLFPCAQFPGSMTGPNVVKALKSSSELYYTSFTMATRGPKDLYVYGGCSGDANPPALDSFVAKVEPGTLKQVWRTDLSDARQNNEIHLCGSVQAIADGSLIATSDHTLYKLNGTTGEIIAKVDLPTGVNPANDTAFNGSDSFPDGTIIAKSWNRVVGCQLNGISAMLKCPGAFKLAKPSILSAVDPNTFKVLGSVQLNTNVSSRITTTRFRGHDYVYVVTISQLYRYEWDGHTLKQDSSFGPVNFTKPGQTGGGSPTLMGDWVILNTEGLSVPMSIVAISQADATRMASIDPNPSMPPGQHSTSAAKPTVDPANHLIYMCDYNLDTASAIDLSDGRLSLAWQVKERTNSFTSLIGPPNKRVFVATNIKSTVTDPTKLVAGPDGANYTEQFQWRDARTGKLLAASDYYAPTSPGDQISPGYGGIVYDMTYTGSIVVLQVLPKSGG